MYFKVCNTNAKNNMLSSFCLSTCKHIAPCMHAVVSRVNKISQRMICLHTKEHSCYWRQASYSGHQVCLMHFRLSRKQQKHLKASTQVICLTFLVFILAHSKRCREIKKRSIIYRVNTATPRSLNEWVFECPGCSIDKVALSSLQWKWWLQHLIAQCTRSPRWHALFWSVYSDRHDLSENHLNHLFFIHIFERKPT